MLKRFLPIVLLALSFPGFAQNKQIDSLKSFVRIAPEDTNTVKNLVTLSWKLRNAGELDSALVYARRGRQLAAKLVVKKQLGKELTIMGVIQMDRGDYDSSEWYHNASLKVREEIGDKKGIAACYNNLGNLYEGRGNLPMALQMHLKALKIREELQDKSDLGASYNNIGNIYSGLKNSNEALKYFERSLAIRKEIKDNLGMAMCYGNIGLIYEANREHAKALETYDLCLALEKKEGYKIGLADCLSNIGSVYHDMGAESKEKPERENNFREGLSYYAQSLKIREEVGDKQGITTSLSNIGSIYLSLGQLQKAENFSLRALETGRPLNDLYLLKDIYKNLSDVYTMLGKHQLALDHYKKFIGCRDSMLNEESTKKTVQLEMQYEFDKKEAATRLEQEKKEAIAAAERKRQKITLWSISAFGILVLIFAVFAYRSFLQKKKTNEEITKQKEIIEEKQKEILDSIHYARRIQRSLLTSDKYIERNLRKHLAAGKANSRK